MDPAGEAHLIPTEEVHGWFGTERRGARLVSGQGETGALWCGCGGERRQAAMVVVSRTGAGVRVKRSRLARTRLQLCAVVPRNFVFLVL